MPETPQPVQRRNPTPAPTASATKPAAKATKPKANGKAATKPKANGKAVVEKVQLSESMTNDLAAYFELSTHSAIANMLGIPYHVVYSTLTGQNDQMPKEAHGKLMTKVKELHKLSERILRHAK